MAPRGAPLVSFEPSVGIRPFATLPGCLSRHFGAGRPRARSDPEAVGRARAVVIWTRRPLQAVPETWYRPHSAPPIGPLATDWLSEGGMELHPTGRAIRGSSDAGPAGASPSQPAEDRDDARTRLRTAELALARLREERATLESVVARLGTVAGRLDAEELALGITEAVRDLTGAPLAMFVPAELTPFTQPVIVCEPGALGQAPDPRRGPLLAGALWRVTPLRLDDASQWGSEQSHYGGLADGRSFRSWVGAPVRARYGDAWASCSSLMTSLMHLESERRSSLRASPPTSGPASTTLPFSRNAPMWRAPYNKPCCPRPSPRSRAWRSPPGTGRQSQLLWSVATFTTCSKCGQACGAYCWETSPGWARKRRHLRE
jgi:hypothetical protein